MTLEFNEPMDEALLDRMILVRDSTGHEIPGTFKIDHQETRWQFTPQGTWSPGNYLIEVDSALEDLAGNKIGRLFDVDLSGKIETTLRSPKIRLNFVVPSK